MSAKKKKKPYPYWVKLLLLCIVCCLVGGGSIDLGIATRLIGLSIGIGFGSIIILIVGGTALLHKMIYDKK